MIDTNLGFTYGNRLLHLWNNYLWLISNCAWRQWFELKLLWFFYLFVNYAAHRGQMKDWNCIIFTLLINSKSCKVKTTIKTDRHKKNVKRHTGETTWNRHAICRGEMEAERQRPQTCARSLQFTSQWSHTDTLMLEYLHTCTWQESWHGGAAQSTASLWESDVLGTKLKLEICKKEYFYFCDYKIMDGNKA